MRRTIPAGAAVLVLLALGIAPGTAGSHPGRASGTIVGTPDSAGTTPSTSSPLGYLHRRAPEKLATTASETTDTKWLEVKFREGSGIRWSSEGLHVSAPATFAGRAASSTDLTQIASALGTSATITSPLFDMPAAELDHLSRTAYEHSGRPQADLNLYYRVRVEPRSAAAVLNRLNSLGIVETAYPAPRAAPPPVPPDFTPSQIYATPTESNGIGIGYARGFLGGTGANVRVHDVEFSWNASHADLSQLQGPVFFANGVYKNPLADDNHGTAVLGELIGDSNSFGVTGLVPGAHIQITNAENTAGYAISNAILVAANALAAGDVMLLEQQLGGPRPPSCTTDSQVGCVPVEWVPSAYDAIVSAVSRGINVVEAGGNGTQNLDDPIYGSPFPRGLSNSGAILVGAAGSGLKGCSPARKRMNFSNFGRRVDLFAWGECIWTTGYGHLYNAEGINAWYTNDFGGTSGASPIVTAAVATISSIAKANGTTLSPAYIRSLLKATGRGGRSTAVIGRQPNLRSAIPRMFGQVAANDNFASPKTLLATQTVDNSGSVRGPGEPRITQNVGGASVWYRYVVPGNGILKLNTRGSHIDTILGVYRGVRLNSLRLLGENDDISFPSIPTSRLTVRVKRGQHLRVAIDGFDGLTGAITLHADFIRR